MTLAEKAKEKGGCRKVAFWAGLGCLALPVLGLLFAGVSLGWGFLFYNHDGPARQETTTVSVPLGDTTAGSPGIQPAACRALLVGHLPGISGLLQDVLSLRLPWLHVQSGAEQVF